MDEKKIEIENMHGDDDTAETEIVDENDGVESNVYELHHGRELLSSETYAITASEKSKLIAILGATGSGKTSLITAIYHLFLQGNPPPQYCFSGSVTLDAFEQRAFNTRVTSNRNNAQMERTPRGKDNRILHLRVTNLKNMSNRNLLFADYSGEDYEGVAADINSAREEFPLIHAAKCIVLLLDGEKIASSRYRLSEIQKAIHLLRTFIDANLLYKSVQILIVISKMDIVKEAEKTSKKISVDKIQKNLLDQLPELINNATIYQIAAMPQNGEGYGISELFHQIVKLNAFETKPAPLLKLSSQFNLWEGRSANG